MIHNTRDITNYMYGYTHNLLQDHSIFYDVGFICYWDWDFIKSQYRLVKGFALTNRETFDGVFFSIYTPWYKSYLRDELTRRNMSPFSRSIGTEDTFNDGNLLGFDPKAITDIFLGEFTDQEWDRLEKSRQQYLACF